MMLRGEDAADLPIALVEAQLLLARSYGIPVWLKVSPTEVDRRSARTVSDRAARSVTVRPVASIEELVRTEQVILAQLPPRHAAPTREQALLEARFEANRTLMLLAEVDGVIVGGALALRTGDAVKVEAIALEPEARRLGIGRQLMEAIEAEAIRLGAQTIYLGGANAENRGFYWRLGFAGRTSLMEKGLPLAGRFTVERLRRTLTSVEGRASRKAHTDRPVV